MYIAKLYAEIRFEPTFLFDDARTKTALLKALKPHYPLYNFDETQKSLIFISQDTKTKVLVFNHRILIDIDEPNDINKIKSVGNSVIPLIMKQFDLTYADRIGVVGQYVDNDHSGFEESAQVIYSKFFNKQLNNLINKHGKVPNNLPNLNFSIPLNQEFNLNVSIAGHQTGAGRLVGDQIEFLTVDSMYPLISMDVYTSIKKETSQINGVLKASCDFISTYVSDIWNLEV